MEPDLSAHEVSTPVIAAILVILAGDRGLERVVSEFQDVLTRVVFFGISGIWGILGVAA